MFKTNSPYDAHPTPLAPNSLHSHHPAFPSPCPPLCRTTKTRSLALHLPQLFLLPQLSSPRFLNREHTSTPLCIGILPRIPHFPPLLLLLLVSISINHVL